MYDQTSVSDHDKNKIEQFKDSIEYKNNYCYAKLPWNEEKIKPVLSNYAVELNVINRVVKKMEQDNLHEKYAKVIHQQEKRG